MRAQSRYLLKTMNDTQLKSMYIFDVVEGVDSSLRDDAGPDGSSEAEILFTMLRGMWTKPSKTQREKKNKEKFAKSTTTVTNRSQRRKTPRKNEENGQQNPARREN